MLVAKLYTKPLTLSQVSRNIGMRIMKTQEWPTRDNAHISFKNSTHLRCFHSFHLLVSQQSAEKTDSLLLWRNRGLYDQESWVYVDHGDYPNAAEVIRENMVYGKIKTLLPSDLKYIKICTAIIILYLALPKLHQWASWRKTVPKLLMVFEPTAEQPRIWNKTSPINLI